MMAKTEAEYHIQELERQIALLIDMAKAAKPDDRSETDRLYAIWITELIKVRAFYMTYLRNA